MRKKGSGRGVLGLGRGALQTSTVNVDLKMTERDLKIWQMTLPRQRTLEHHKWFQVGKQWLEVCCDLLWDLRVTRGMSL